MFWGDSPPAPRGLRPTPGGISPPAPGLFARPLALRGYSPGSWASNALVTGRLFPGGPASSQHLLCPSNVRISSLPANRPIFPGIPVIQSSRWPRPGHERTDGPYPLMKLPKPLQRNPQRGLWHWPAAVISPVGKLRYQDEDIVITMVSRSSGPGTLRFPAGPAKRICRGSPWMESTGGLNSSTDNMLFFRLAEPKKGVENFFFSTPLIFV